MAVHNIGSEMVRGANTKSEAGIIDCEPLAIERSHPHILLPLACMRFLVGQKTLDFRGFQSYDGR